MQRPRESWKRKREQRSPTEQEPEDASPRSLLLPSSERVLPHGFSRGLLRGVEATEESGSNGRGSEEVQERVSFERCWVALQC